MSTVTRQQWQYWARSSTASFPAVFPNKENKSTLFCKDQTDITYYILQSRITHYILLQPTHHTVHLQMQLVHKYKTLYQRPYLHRNMFLCKAVCHTLLLWAYWPAALMARPNARSCECNDSSVHGALSNPKTSILIQKRHPYTGNLNSETCGDSQKTCLHCGDVLGMWGSR